MAGSGATSPVIGFNQLCMLPHLRSVSVSATQHSGHRNRSVLTSGTFAAGGAGHWQNAENA